jgi:hypothetical protein
MSKYSKTIVIILCCLSLLGTFCFLFIYGYIPIRSKKSMVNHVLGAKASSHVKILNASQGIEQGSSEWIHGYISPADLNALLVSRPYTHEDALGYAGPWPNAPAWWKPSSLGAKIEVFSWIHDNNNDVIDTRCLITNDKRSEFYAVWFTNW